MPELVCPREGCGKAVHRPPINGKHRCFNCGHSWDVEAPAPVPAARPEAAVTVVLSAPGIQIQCSAGADLEDVRRMFVQLDTALRALQGAKP